MLNTVAADHRRHKLSINKLVEQMQDILEDDNVKPGEPTRNRPTHQDFNKPQPGPDPEPQSDEEQAEILAQSDADAEQRDYSTPEGWYFHHLDMAELKDWQKQVANNQFAAFEEEFGIDKPEELAAAIEALNLTVAELEAAEQEVVDADQADRGKVADKEANKVAFKTWRAKKRATNGEPPEGAGLN